MFVYLLSPGLAIPKRATPRFNRSMTDVKNSPKNLTNNDLIPRGNEGC